MKNFKYIVAGVAALLTLPWIMSAGEYRFTTGDGLSEGGTSSSSGGVSEGDDLTDGTANRVVITNGSTQLATTIPLNTTSSLLSANNAGSTGATGAILLKTGVYSGFFGSGKAGSISLDVGTGYDMGASGEKPNIYFKTAGTTRAYFASGSPYGLNIGSGIGDAAALLIVGSGSTGSYLVKIGSGTFSSGEPTAFGIEGDGDLIMGASHTASITFRGQPIIPNNAAPRTNVTPRAAYAEIINTGATPPELCISTGTAVDTWALSSNMALPCSN